jgi:hypothetical protein
LASIRTRSKPVADDGTDCVKSPSVGFVLVLVLVLYFSGIFEDEDENEDEDAGPARGFSHSLFRRRLHTSAL